MKERLEKHSEKLFLAVLLLVLLLLGFHEYISLHPIGPHYIRQTDCIAFVEYYIQNDFNFFHPGGWNLGSSNGEACSEFPVLYYFAGLISLFTENKHIVLRLISLTISVIGFFYLFSLIKLIVKDIWSSLLLSLLLLSSTILLFYSVNFLPDSSALAFTLIGWYFGLRTGFELEKPNSTKAFIFFLLAALLKVTYFIHPMAFICAILLARYKSTSSFKETSLKEKKRIMWFLSTALLVFVWNLFSVNYTLKYGSGLFLTTVLPIWEIGPELVGRVWLAIHHDWFSSYFYPTTMHTFLAIIILGAVGVFKTKEKSVLPVILLFLFLGSAGYALLFYSQFLDHDYYFLNFYPFVVIGFSYLFHRIQLWLPKLMSTPYPKVVLMIVAILSFNYANGKLKERFSFISPVFEKNRTELEGIDKYFDQKGIPEKAKFIVIGEPTSNGAFYWMNRSGWVIKEWDLKGKKIWEKYNSKTDYVLVTPGMSIPNETMCQLVDTYQNTKIYTLKDR